jgi:hypothetical protein
LPLSRCGRWLSRKRFSAVTHVGRWQSIFAAMRSAFPTRNMVGFVLDLRTSR